jgi:hypothetical protein
MNEYKELNFPCVCGHKYDEHEWMAWNEVCWADMSVPWRGKLRSCPCTKYTPDNLAYIKQLHEKKALDKTNNS